ncbi:MAG: DUF1015 domain-containing protein [Anaerovoracaceae bacterium]|jgi:uncharacterized protein (DUF1015 family)
MAIIKPFAAVRPAQKYVEKLISLPYDVMSRKEAAEMAKGNPVSFLHISRSEIDLPNCENPYDSEVYKKAKNNIKDFLSQGVLIQDNKPMFYIYRQTMEGRIQTGIVACVSIDEYQDNTIKKHEFTRVEKELDRINHFDTCNANTEPVFLTYRDRNDLRDVIETQITNKTPVYDLVTSDGVGHTLWVVDNDTIIKNLIEIFKEIPALYIADGHHRSASAVKVGLKRREANPGYTGEEEFNYFMAVLFPDIDLNIFDYNRVIKDLNGLTTQEFLNKLTELFSIEIIKKGPYRPEGKHIFSMYLDGHWYKLTAKESILSDDLVKGLDVSILQDHVLAPILNIQDPRTDKRIDFVGGIRGLGELERRVCQDMTVAFALYPVSITDLLAVSDQDRIMPPKSTWFEPKLGSGLFIHLL